MTRKQTIFWVTLTLCAAAALCSFHVLRGGFGVRESELEAHIRQDQQVPEGWLSTSQTREDMTAWLFFPPDWTEQTDPNRDTPIFSIYQKSGLLLKSWHYQAGGSGPSVLGGTEAFRLGGWQVCFSMNREGFSSAAWESATQSLDPARPFVLILPAEEAPAFYQ